MSEKIVAARVYYLVFACLIALTLITVWLSFVELGAWHTVVGLAIAACKASLVALFFMHVLYGGRLVWLLLGTGLFWLRDHDDVHPGRLSHPSLAGLLRAALECGDTSAFFSGRLILPLGEGTVYLKRKSSWNP